MMRGVECRTHEWYRDRSFGRLRRTRHQRGIQECENRALIDLARSDGGVAGPPLFPGDIPVAEAVDAGEG